MSSLNLKGGHLLTIGAVIFAGFALAETFKKPGGVTSTQPGQQQRDSGLTAFMNLLTSQASNVASNLQFDANLQEQAANIAANSESTTPNF